MKALRAFITLKLVISLGALWARVWALRAKVSDLTTKVQEH